MTSILIERPPLSQSSLTFKMIQKFPEPMRETATKIAEFVQRDKIAITMAAGITSAIFLPPLAFEASVISLLVVAGLRTASFLLPRNISDTFRPVTHLETVDKGMLIIAGSIASMISSNPLLLVIGVQMSGAHEVCDFAKLIVDYAGRKITEFRRPQENEIRYV